MPKGKGTYGSQVGRPSKKKYQAGGEVAPNFPMENPAVEDANKMGQELKSIPLGGIEPDFPMSNAMERSENYQLGGAVRPPTAPSIQPPQYKKGGKVDVTDIVKSVGKREKAKKSVDEIYKKKSWSKKDIKKVRAGSEASSSAMHEIHEAKKKILPKAYEAGAKRKGKKKR